MFTTIGITIFFLYLPHLNEKIFKFDYILSFQQCELMRILDLICISPLSNPFVIIDFLIWCLCKITKFDVIFTNKTKVVTIGVKRHHAQKIV
jgi:hypothetical protein